MADRRRQEASVSDIPVPYVATIAELRTEVRIWRKAHERVALVPTMGALHDGHLALVRLARANAERVVVSVFVNPTQFAPHEDFDRYPRTLESDLAKLATAGCDLVWAPAVQDMYPDGFATRVVPSGAADGLETEFRPHFFAGVATVCTKLFNQVTPDYAIFGEKDFQQLAVIRQTVRDLDLPLEIVGAPIVRETDGLAMSSRNRYLSEKERNIAPSLYRTLRAAASNVAAEGAGLSAEQAEQMMREALLMLVAVGFHKVDYVALRHAVTLRPFETGMRGPFRILAAAWLGKTRLIDNVPA
jgi:pantoate--beta-alanine ligase